MKNKRFIQSILLLKATFFSVLAYAHSGHDHNSWFSGLVHLFQLLTAIAAIAAVAFFIRQVITKKEHSIKVKQD